MTDHKTLIGSHTSIAKGVHFAFHRALEVGATTMQIFTANQRQWSEKLIDQEEVEKYFHAQKETNIDIVMAHDSYLINLASSKPAILEQSRKAFAAEIKRCKQLCINYLNFHPGAYVDATEEQGLQTIIESLLLMRPLLEKSSLQLLLETTAGQGTNLGYTFEQIGYLVKNLKQQLPIGVCIDTCHIFAAGYDIRDENRINQMLLEFDKHIGIHHLAAMHLNDSKFDLGMKKDRHEHIGKGKIGLPAFISFMNHPKTKHLPKYLETPDPALWRQEIALLKKAIQ